MMALASLPSVTVLASLPDEKRVREGSSSGSDITGHLDVSSKEALALRKSDGSEILRKIQL